MIDPDAFIHPLAVVCGDVALGARASVWPFAVVRGDNDHVAAGEETNVQDGAVLHADPGLPCVLGARVSVGHRAVVHGARVDDGALVGMSALVLNGARVGAGALVAAGPVVCEEFAVPAGTLAAGVPARVLRALTADESARLARTAAAYVRLQQRHARGEVPRHPGDSVPRPASAARTAAPGPVPNTQVPNAQVPNTTVAHTQVPNADDMPAIHPLPAVGDVAELTRVVGDADLRSFAEATGDFDLVHFADAAAARTRPGGRVAHGMRSAGLVSAAIAGRLPGPGSVSKSQTLLPPPRAPGRRRDCAPGGTGGRGRRAPGAPVYRVHHSARRGGARRRGLG